MAKMQPFWWFIPPKATHYETRYMTSDSHNLLTGQFWLYTYYSFPAQKNIGVDALGDLTTYVYVQVYVKHADGTTTLLQDWILIGIRTVNGEGYQSVDWNCPDTVILKTDAIFIYTKCNVGNVNAYASHFTEALGATKLNAATWTFTLYTRRLYTTFDNKTSCEFYFGISTKNSHIENFVWTG